MIRAVQGNLLTHVIIAFVGLAMILLSRKFEQAGSITPTFIGGGMILLSFLSIGLAEKKFVAAFDARKNNKSAYKSIYFVVLIASWVLSLPYLGFLCSGFLFFTFISLLVPRVNKISWKTCLVAFFSGAITTSIFWALLTQILQIPLPDLNLTA
tara:strand:- start:3562 stop:4023 length:462 start_codon:yes stop_codon:yes gene_type:complete